MPFTPWGASTASGQQAYQFTPEAYGAQGNGKIGTGGTGTSGTTAFSDAGANFTSADVGKYIIINQGAGSATVPTNAYVGTISQVNSPTSVTLSSVLGANASSAPYVYGTDDSAAINAAVLAAFNYAIANQYKAQIIFQPKLYVLGALVQTTAQNWPGNTGPYTYNTHIPIPFSPTTARKLIIDFVGVGDASEPDFWASAVPSVQGTMLVSASFATAQPNGTFGQQSVIGAPALNTNIPNGGLTGGNFANVLVNVNGIGITTPYGAGQYAFDFRLAAQANMGSGAALAFAPVNFTGAAVGGTWLRQTSITNVGTSVGLAMPIAVNNDNCNVGLYSCEGLAVGLLVSEHFTATRIATIYCDWGIKVTSGAVIHGGSILYYSCEGCNWGIHTDGGTGAYTLDIMNADFEGMNLGYVSDAGNMLNGTMFFDDLTANPTTGPGNSGASKYQIISTRMVPGPWAANATTNIPAPPSAPASATPQQNTGWRNAMIYASASTSITGISVGPTSGALTALGLTGGANVPVPVFVPSGHWYSVTYTGTLTNIWVLG